MDVMTLKEARTKYFKNNISYGKLLTMAKRGELPIVRIGGRYYTRMDLLESWFATQAAKQNEPQRAEKPAGYGRLRVVGEQMKGAVDNDN